MQFKLEDEILVIDNFFTDLSWVRDLVKEKTFTAPSMNFFGGSYAMANYPEVINSMSRIENLCGSNYNHLSNSGFIRSTQKSDRASLKSLVHYDFLADISALVYLTAPPIDTGEGEQGTWFYEHKKLQRRSIPITSEIQKKWAHETILKDCLDLDAWRCWRKVEHVKNRLVMFDSKLFHSISPNFYGQNLEESRLVVNYFLKRKQEI